jgi:hypothetical protein
MRCIRIVHDQCQGFCVVRYIIYVQARTNILSRTRVSVGNMRHGFERRALKAHGLCFYDHALFIRRWIVDTCWVHFARFINSCWIILFRIVLFCRIWIVIRLHRDIFFWLHRRVVLFRFVFWIWIHNYFLLNSFLNICHHMHLKKESALQLKNSSVEYYSRIREQAAERISRNHQKNRC